MVAIIRIFLILLVPMVCVYCAKKTAPSGFMGVQWYSSRKYVAGKYANLKKLTIPLIDDITMFEGDTVHVWSEQEGKSTEKNVIKRFSFLKGKLRNVEVLYDSSIVRFNYFNNTVLKNLVDLYGDYNVYEKDDNEFMTTHYFKWEHLNTVVMAMFGHFKGLMPQNYDWIKVRYYEKSFYEIKHRKDRERGLYTIQKVPLRREKGEKTKNLKKKVPKKLYY
jgi:hypothetical protein